MLMRVTPRSFWGRATLAGLALGVVACAVAVNDPGGSGSSGNGTSGSGPTSGAGGGSSAGAGGGTGSGGAPHCDATHFDATPVDFALPPFVTQNMGQGLLNMAGSESCGTYASTYATIDFDGDGRLDLVFTRNCADAGTYVTGKTKWIVFKGEPSGFASTPIDYALPPFVTQNGGTGVLNLAGTESCGTYASTYATMDMDGDGKLDLVFTRNCADAGNYVTGKTKWLVFKGTLFGFSPTATDYALPPFVTQSGGTGVLNVSGTESCGTYASTYTTMDLDGDKRLDLVFTRNCADAGNYVTGKTKWIYFKGGPNGFASTPSDFALPPFVTDNGGTGVLNIAGTESCGTYASTYTTMDMDADGKPDLVFTRNCADAGNYVTGKTKWFYFKGGPTGFASTPTNYLLPPFVTQNGGTGLLNIAGTESCGTYASTYATIDIDGDGRLDLVFTRNCADAGMYVTGKSKWMYFKGGAFGFAATPTDFPLPPFVTENNGTGLLNLAGSESCGTYASTYATTDLDGDGRLDLVFTRNCADAGNYVTGKSKWLFFRGQCN
jgi:hypothetical protein